jgi:hypothetical protein
MKNKIYLLILMGALFAINGCQTPDELLPPVAHSGINSVTAYFTDADGNILDADKGKFTANVTEGNTAIVISVPFYFPEESDNQVTTAMLSKMKMRANLDDNVMVEPALLYMDLNQSNAITVTTQRKEKVEYTVSSVIRKSSACVIEEFKLPSLNLDGIINETAKTISLVTLDNLEPATATIRLSPHATISPDPRTTAIDYNTNRQLVVTAHDGTTATYTVQKAVPAKLTAGIRPGSAKILFEKKTIADLGAPTHNHGGLAASNDYVMISTRAAQSIVIDAKTGELLTSVDVSAIGGTIGFGNFYNTADDAGHILICNLAQNHGTFKVWKLNTVSSALELYIDWSANTLAIGRKLSVQGDIAGDAIITAPLHSGTPGQFARWQVIGGVLQSQTPDIVAVNGLTWTTHVDVVYTSATNLNADYFVARYGDHSPGANGNIYSQLNWINGATHATRAELVKVNSNFIANAVDYIVFNNTPYALVNYVNGYNWGQADQVMLVNAADANSFTCEYTSWGAWPTATGAVEWTTGIVGGYSIYNYAAAGGSTPNTNNTGDVAFVQSPDGFFLYVYFMFTNGYVVGVQFDCIDM